MSTPGLQKLNIPKKTNVSPKAAIANNLRSQGVAQGTSWGIFAQRTMTGLGVQYNNRAFNSGSISATRHALNDNRTIVNNNIGYGHVHSNNGNNTMNKFMAGMMAMNMLGQLGANIADTVKSTKPSDKGDILSNSPATPSDNSNIDNLSNKLSKATSFQTINNIETELGTKLTNFGTEYNKIGKDSSGNNLIEQTLSAEDIKAGLSSAGVKIDYSSLNLSDITLTDASTIQDIESAVGQIDTDKKAVEEFQDSQVKTAIKSCKDKSEALNTEIRGIDSQIQGLEGKKTGNAEADAGIDQQIKELKEKKAALEAEKAKVDKAKDALETTVKQQISDITSALDTKKDELNDLKKTKSELADKKYDLAKEQDEKINKNKQKMDKLNTEINTLRKSTTDAKKGKDNLNKLNAKINEYNGLVNNMKSLYTSLQNAGATDFTNSKGKNYTVKNTSEDTKYTTIITPIPVQGAGKDLNLSGDASTQNQAIKAQIENCQVGEAIDIGNGTYTKGADGNFTSDLGQIFTALDLMKSHIQNQNNPLSNLLN